ncbi:HAS-barrel domain-containing protein [Desulfofalx alkaliphila]|uniref:HAS-barrel domain-containing protein n=1 Tax=Desulfofalx alkaliphila TaxID=105483 RepID=UPI0004E0E04E|nr:HAS-barrel domain-containing protein [Desulfofalx alkaliphila]
MLVNNEAIGEVIESDTTQFTCEASHLHSPPEFGSFVQVDNGDTGIIGVVFHTTTLSSDPGRKPMAYWQSEDELRRQQPQIFYLLRTYFSVLVVGHCRDGSYNGYLPPRPARIHSFVRRCDGLRYQQVGENVNYISTILGSGCEAKDELLAAAVRNISKYQQDEAVYLRRVGNELRRLLVADYERFKSIVRRIRR